MPFEHPEYNATNSRSLEAFMADISGNLRAMIGNAFKSFSAFGAHVMQHHQFAAYLPKIQEIAQREFIV